MKALFIAVRRQKQKPTEAKVLQRQQQLQQQQPGSSEQKTEVNKQFDSSTNEMKQPTEDQQQRLQQQNVNRSKWSQRKQSRQSMNFRQQQQRNVSESKAECEQNFEQQQQQQLYQQQQNVKGSELKGKQQQNANEVKVNRQIVIASKQIDVTQIHTAEQQMNLQRLSANSTKYYSRLCKRCEKKCGEQKQSEETDDRIKRSETAATTNTSDISGNISSETGTEPDKTKCSRTAAAANTSDNIASSGHFSSETGTEAAIAAASIGIGQRKQTVPVAVSVANVKSYTQQEQPSNTAVKVTEENRD